MDIERFHSMLNDTSKTQKDLVQMRENALSKNAIEHVHLAERVLDDRFPSWRSVRSRRGGATPTVAMFLGETRYFGSQKEAYVWLMGHFIRHYPEPFKTINRETYFVAKGEKSFYFHRSLDRLFDGDEEKISDPNKYHRFPNGWYAKLVLSEEQKQYLLHKFALVAHLQMGVDWDWNECWKHLPSIDEMLSQMSGTYEKTPPNLP